MNRLAIALFALVAVTAAYRVQESDEAPRWRQRHHETEGAENRGHLRHGFRHHHGMLHNYFTSEIFKAVEECKRKTADQADGFGCLVSCVMQKIGEMTESGKLNEQKIVADIQMKAQIEEKIARSCIAEVHSGDVSESCQTAEAYVKCVLKKTFSLAAQ